MCAAGHDGPGAPHVPLADDGPPDGFPDLKNAAIQLRTAALGFWAPGGARKGRIF